jgi:hypothetical protein
MAPLRNRMGGLSSGELKSPVTTNGSSVARAATRRTSHTALACREPCSASQHSDDP